MKSNSKSDDGRTTIFCHIDSSPPYSFTVNSNALIRKIYPIVSSAAELPINSFGLYLGETDLSTIKELSIKDAFNNLDEVHLSIIRYDPVQQDEIFPDDLALIIGIRCKQHQSNYLTFYCFTCQMSICLECCKSDHSTHNFVEKVNLIKDSNMVTENVFKNVRSYYIECDQNGELEELKNQICNEYFHQLHCMINAIQDKFIKLIEFYKKNLNDCKSTINENVQTIKDFCSRGLDQLKSDILLQNICIDDNIVITLDRKYKELEQNNYQFKEDYSKYENLSKFSQEINHLAGSYYEDLFKIFDEKLKANNISMFYELISRLKVHKISQEEVTMKILSDCSCQRRSLLSSNLERIKNYKYSVNQSVGFSSLNDTNTFNCQIQNKNNSVLDKSVKFQVLNKNPGLMTYENKKISGYSSDSNKNSLKTEFVFHSQKINSNSGNNLNNNEVQMNIDSHQSGNKNKEQSNDDSDINKYISPSFCNPSLTIEKNDNTNQNEKNINNNKQAEQINEKSGQVLNFNNQSEHTNSYGQILSNNIQFFTQQPSTVNNNNIRVEENNNINRKSNSAKSSPQKIKFGFVSNNNIQQNQTMKGVNSNQKITDYMINDIANNTFNASMNNSQQIIFGFHNNTNLNNYNNNEINREINNESSVSFVSSNAMLEESLNATSNEPIFASSNNFLIANYPNQNNGNDRTCQKAPANQLNMDRYLTSANRNDNISRNNNIRNTSDIFTNVPNPFSNAANFANNINTSLNNNNIDDKSQEKNSQQFYSEAKNSNSMLNKQKIYSYTQPSNLNQITIYNKKFKEDNINNINTNNNISNNKNNLSSYINKNPNEIDKESNINQGINHIEEINENLKENTKEINKKNIIDNKEQEEEQQNISVNLEDDSKTQHLPEIGEEENYSFNEPTSKYLSTINCFEYYLYPMEKSSKILITCEKKNEFCEVSFPPDIKENYFLDKCGHCNYNQILYISGGIAESTNFSNRVMKYDYSKSANKISILKSMNYGRANHTMIGYKNSIIAVGGIHNNSVERYYFDKQEWETLDNMTEQERQFAMLDIYDDCLFVFGGYSEKIGNIDKIEMLNLKDSQASFCYVNYINEADVEFKFYGCGLIHLDDKLYFIGGKYQTTETVKDALLFDYQTNTIISLEISGSDYVYFKEPKLFKLTSGNFYNIQENGHIPIGMIISTNL